MRNLQKRLQKRIEKKKAKIKERYSNEISYWYVKTCSRCGLNQQMLLSTLEPDYAPYICFICAEYPELKIFKTRG